MRSSTAQVAVEDSVVAPRGLSGRSLRDGFFESASTLTLGLIRYRDGALRIFGVDLLRFGRPVTHPNSVSWPIEGGLLAAAPGGKIEVSAAGGMLKTTVSGYMPRLPRVIYLLTQLQVHHALVRLQLLRLRGRVPSPGYPADPVRRITAGAIDAGLCAGVALALARRHRLRAFAWIAAGYHVACWSLTGRTLGGALMQQRVVSVDGSQPRFAQSLLRFAAIPLMVVRRRALHDELAGTDVIEGG